MEHIASAIGSPSFIARICGVTVPSVLGWKGRVPVQRCPAIEAGTAGKWPVERIRPDACWVRQKDSQWPWNVEGRPLLDLTGGVRFSASDFKAATQGSGGLSIPDSSAPQPKTEGAAA